VGPVGIRFFPSGGAVDAVFFVEIKEVERRKASSRAGRARYGSYSGVVKHVFRF
jgi:hypothetical protein